MPSSFPDSPSFQRFEIAAPAFNGGLGANGPGTITDFDLITDDTLGVPRPHPNEPVHVDIMSGICERFIFAPKNKNRVRRFTYADTLQEFSWDTRVRIYPGKLAPLIEL